MIYICECCGKEWQHSIDAYKCEAKCLGMTYGKYKSFYKDFESLEKLKEHILINHQIKEFGRMQYENIESLSR